MDPRIRRQLDRFGDLDDVGAASDELTAIERTFDPADAPSRARAFAAHARALLDAASRADPSRDTLAWRDRALVKANRALRTLEDRGDADPVKLEVLRIRVAALCALPGREAQAREAAEALVGVLEPLSIDTRIERAQLWLAIAGLRAPHHDSHGPRRTRAALAPVEAALRASIALFLDAAREPEHLDRLADAIVALVSWLVESGSGTAIDALAAELAPRIAGPLGERLREDADAWSELPGRPAAQIAAMLRRIAGR